MFYRPGKNSEDLGGGGGQLAPHRRSYTPEG